MAIDIAYKTWTNLSIGATEVSFNTGTTTLTPDTTVGYFMLWVDLSNLAAGDEYEFAMVEAARSGGTGRRVVLYRAVGAQPEPLVGPAILLGNGWYYSGKKIVGTDRTVDASIRAVT